MSDTRIFTPRASIRLLNRDPQTSNPSVCTKVPYHGHVISIIMDSSHGPGDLVRSDIVIHDEHGADVTELLLPEYCSVVPATAESLKEAFAAIEEMTLLPG